MIRNPFLNKLSLFSLSIAILLGAIIIDFSFPSTSYADPGYEACVVSDEPRMAWANYEIDAFLNCRGLSNFEYNQNGLPLNYNLVRERGVLAYGARNQFAWNDYSSSTGEWRYLGETISGTRFPNLDFPPDASATTNVGTRNYYYKPWEISNEINNSNTPVDTIYMQMYSKEEQIEWLDRAVDKYSYGSSQNPRDRGNWLPNYPGNVLIDYAVIHAPPTDYGPGYITLWHQGTNTDWYDTHILAPYKELFPDPNQPTPEEPEICPPEGPSGGAVTTSTGVSGEYTYYASPMNHVYDTDGYIIDSYLTEYTGYYYESLTVEMHGADPKTVKAGQGTEVFATTVYTNENPDHQGEPLAPSSMTITAKNTEDWPNVETMEVELIPSVSNPETHWGSNQEVEWRIPWAMIHPDGKWEFATTESQAQQFLNQSEFNFGGEQRWYVGFDVPDGEEFSLAMDGLAGVSNQLNVCDERRIDVEGSPYDDFVVRVVDPHNPFPHEVGRNWEGQVNMITNLSPWYAQEQVELSDRVQSNTENRNFLQRIQDSFTDGFRRFRGE